VFVRNPGFASSNGICYALSGEVDCSPVSPISKGMVAAVARFSAAAGFAGRKAYYISRSRLNQGDEK